MPRSWEDEDDSRYPSGFDLQQTAITFLKVFAWLDLFGGIVGAIIIWKEFSTSPVAIGIGIAVVLQGIFTWAFFLVVAYIALNVIAIRENTTPRQQPPK